MSTAPDIDAVWESLNIAFYALVQQLENVGAIDADRLADEIARYNSPDNQSLMANLNGIVITLRNRPFAVRPTIRGVIDGGKTMDN